MSQGFETIDIIEPWLWETLSTDEELLMMVGGVDSIIGTLAKGNIRPPYVVWAEMSALDVRVVGMDRSQVDTVYMVKAVAEEASWSTVRPIANRLDELLSAVNVTTPNGSVSCVRESIIQYAEVVSATQFRHLGATFRIRANSL